MKGISEKPVSPDTLLSIKKCARSAIRILGIEPRASTPSAIAAGVDRFVQRWQKGQRPPEAMLPADDVPLFMGSLWGEAIVSRFKWEWGMVMFHDHDRAILPAVLAPDRSLAIYPLHFLTECLNDPIADVCILSAYNLLKSGMIENLEPLSYLNLMDRVQRVAVRE